MPIRVLIIDDHPMVVEGVKALLQGTEGVEVVSTAYDAFSALAFLKTGAAVDVALLDINLPDLSGIELCQKLKQDFPGLKILALSTFKERSYITRMIEQGASGYVLKSISREELLDALAQAHAGRLYMGLEISQILIQAQAARKALPALTNREKEVLACIAEGLTNPQIADKLFVSPLTVDSHRKNLLAKFGVKNTAALVRFAVEQGLV
jgi:DNA-binding NarL/FixJ family response regulator